jgi:hypothetical protein
VKLQGYSYDDLVPVDFKVFMVAGAPYKNAQGTRTISCDRVRSLNQEESIWLVNLAIQTRKEEIKKKISENPDNNDLCEPVIP